MPDKMFLSNFEPDEFVPLIGFGIVNPFGPTFMGYGFKRSLNDKIELIFFSLNPFDVFIDKLHSFNQTFLDAQIEAVILGSEAPNIIQNFLSRKVSEKQAFGTPSFMCVNIDLWREDLREVIQGIIFDTIKFSSEPHSTLTDLKAFPLNVMDRVSYEMRKSLDPGNLVQATDEEIIELIGIIIDYEHVDQELKGFFIAWDGAINHQAEQGSGQLASDAIDLESFIDILILMFPDLFAEQNDNLDTAEYSGLKCPICNEHLGCSHHVASVNRNAGECEDGIWLDEENKFVSMIESSFLANLKNGRGLASDNKELQLQV